MSDWPNDMNIWALPNFGHHKATNAARKAETSHATSGMFMPMLTSMIERDRARNNAFERKIREFYTQASDACKEGFVIFDQTGSKNTVILHPSWLNHRSYRTTLEPQTERSAEYLNSQDSNEKAMEALQSVHGSPTLLHQVETNLYRDGNFRDHLKMHISEDINVSIKMNNEKTKPMCNTNAQKNDKTRVSISSSSKIETEFHEDTKEIDALLSSDSELSSTGHSPGDPSSNNSIKLEEITGHSIRSPKRKFKDVCSDVDDDADSGGPEEADFKCVSQSQDAFPSCLSSGARDECLYWKTVLQNVNFSGEPSSSKNDTPLGIPGTETKSHSYCSLRGSSRTFAKPTASAKRIKIKSNIQQLKDVIPGGNGLDTAELLAETVHYVNCLQSRLWDLEASRHLDRTSGSS